MAQPDFQALRVKMVDGQLRTTDVTSHEILSAFLAVPREQFVDEDRRALAYLDDDIQIAPGRFMMEPSPLAKLLQLAAIAHDDKVLIVGAGTGYSAAVIASIAAHVVALENDAALSEAMNANLQALNLSNIDLLTGSLEVGAPSKGPFNVILIEGAVSAVPHALLDQLAEGGRLVAVEGMGLTGVAQCYLRSDRLASASRGFNVSVKPLPGFAAIPTFQF